mgnify:CR=1 FL=1
MFVYILKRILLMVPTLLGALTITFVVMQFVPGGPVEQAIAEARANASGGADGYRAGRDLDKKQIEELKKLYGFDKPVHVRYWEMLVNFAQFDLGRSFMHNKVRVYCLTPLRVLAQRRPFCRRNWRVRFFKHRGSNWK